MATEVASDLEQRLVASINAERAAEGLSPLKIEAHLNASAQGHSEWMSEETGRFGHFGENGSSPTERIEEAGFPLSVPGQTAENVAEISVIGDLDAGEVDRMHEGLMNSSGHRANMLDPNAAYVGIGLAVGNIGGQDVAFLTEDFANTEGQVLVQEEVEGQTVLQPFQDGEPVGDPLEPDTSQPEDPDDEADPEEEEDEEREPETASVGGCFVATAAYGSWTHPDVVALRRFRDEVLVMHTAGRAFIRTYQVVGPRLARLVSAERPSGRIARAMIAPLARLAGSRGATGSP